MSPSSGLASLNAGVPSRSPEGTAWERPGARPAIQAGVALLK